MTAQSILFRTDASLDIGTGHVMRCLTLAEALRERGASCRFVCRAHPGNLIDLIRQRGFAVHALLHDPNWRPSELAPAYASWLGADWRTDAEQTKVGAGATAVDWLTVDHYALDARWERQLRPVCRKLMVIDDLADRDHDCDVLLDQNLGRHAENYVSLVLRSCTVLAGPRYALLRPEFAALRPYSLIRRSSPQFKHLLIAMGGVDMDDATGKVLDALRICPLPEDCRITVVMGSHAPWLAQVRTKAATMPRPTEVQVNIRDMAILMADSDLAIGAAGSTSWERCCLGLPTIVILLAKNQFENGKALEAAGLAIVIPSPHVSPCKLAESLASALHNILGDYAKISSQCTAISDGNGVQRLLNILETPHDIRCARFLE